MDDYEVLLDDLRMQLQGEQRQLEKLQQDLEERDEEIGRLRNDYRDAQDTNEKLEQNAMDLNHKLSQQKEEIRLLRKTKINEIEREVREENEHLHARLAEWKVKYEKLLTSYEALQNEMDDMKQPEIIKEELTATSTVNTITSADEMQELVQQMVRQYESEIHINRTSNQATIDGLQMQLEAAIVDKEEIAESYILEIERLDLALTEAVNRLSDFHKRHERLRATLHNCGLSHLINSPVQNSARGLRFRSLKAEVPIMNSNEQCIGLLPPDTEVFCSKVFRRSCARIIQPEKYQGLVELQTNSGVSLLEAVSSSGEKDNRMQSDDMEIERGRIDECKMIRQELL